MFYFVGEGISYKFTNERGLHIAFHVCCTCSIRAIHAISKPNILPSTHFPGTTRFSDSRRQLGRLGFFGGLVQRLDDAVALGDLLICPEPTLAQAEQAPGLAGFSSEQLNEDRRVADSEPAHGPQSPSL